MDNVEKTIETEELFRGKIIYVHRDIVELPDGSRSFREIVDHHGGVCVVAVDENGLVPIVRQYRYAFKKELIEIPAGKLEAGEEPRDCAIRELSEETGYTAGRVESLGIIYPTAGYCSEVIHMYLATDLTPGKRHLDEGELLETEKMPLETLYEKCLKGEINDAKTVVALARARAQLGMRNE